MNPPDYMLKLPNLIPRTSNLNKNSYRPYFLHIEVRKMISFQNQCRSGALHSLFVLHVSYGAMFRLYKESQILMTPGAFQLRLSCMQEKIC